MPRTHACIMSRTVVPVPKNRSQEEEEHFEVETPTQQHGENFYRQRERPRAGYVPREDC